MAAACENLPVFPERPVVRTFLGWPAAPVRWTRKPGDAHPLAGTAAVLLVEFGDSAFFRTPGPRVPRDRAERHGSSGPFPPLPQLPGVRS